MKLSQMVQYMFQLYLFAMKQISISYFNVPETKNIMLYDF